ncbi:MAG TPA: hypothetical protein VFX60_15650 [Micromonospora sp.]|nr:hypothetical protein [Micromonospora sp.]
MTEAGGERQSRLRTGPWLPPAHPKAPSADEVFAPRTATAPPTPDPAPTRRVRVPAFPIREAVPPPSAAPPAGPPAWLPPTDSALIRERPAHRRADLIGASSFRGLLFTAVAIVTAVPLTLGVAATPPHTDLPAGPLSALQPRPGITPLLAPAPPMEPNRPLPAGPLAAARARAHPAGVHESSTRPAGTAATSPATLPAGTVAGRTSPKPDDDIAPQPQAPPPAEPAVILSFEAEGDLVVWSGPARRRELADASGGVVVGGRDRRLGPRQSNGVSARFDHVAVPETADYTITLYYATPDPRRAMISVNGRRSWLHFDAPDRAGQSIAAVSIPARLAAGFNVIEFGNVYAPIPDLDRIVVTRNGS